MFERRVPDKSSDSLADRVPTDALLAAKDISSNLPMGLKVNVGGAMGNMGGWGIAGQLTYVIWGLLLCLMSNYLACSITEYFIDTTRDNQEWDEHKSLELMEEKE